MSGIRPDQLDYNALVHKMDQQGYDWQSLMDATEDPGFSGLDPAHQRHVWDLIRVKAAQKAGETIDPYARTGKLAAFRTIGNFLKGVAMDVATPGGGAPEMVQSQKRFDEMVGQDKVNQDILTQQGREIAQRDLASAGHDIVQQFAHYFTGGLVDAPKDSKDPYVQEAMQGVKSATGLAAIGGQLVLGSALLGWVSKIPLISGRVANLSAATRGLVKGAILDFGVNAAWPEGLPKEERLGISDDIARAIAPETALKDPTSVAGRLASGVGGAVEGALLGSLLFGIGHGVKLADSKYAFSITSKQVEKMKASLESLGIDASQMTKRDTWMTYRTNMTKHVQDVGEAVFNGERMSAEQWIAQAFLADPNVTELTSAEGRLLWGVFSNNKGGVSVIKGVTNPEQALEKLRKVGINVEAHVIPRSGLGADGRVSGAARRISVEEHAFKEITPEELDRAVNVDESLVSAKNAPSEGMREPVVNEPQPPGSVAAAAMGRTPDEIAQILHPSAGLPEGVSAPAQRESAASIAQSESDKAAVDELVGEPTADAPVTTTLETQLPKHDVVQEHAPRVDDLVAENELNPPPANSLFPAVWAQLNMTERQSLLGVGKESKSLASRHYTDLPEATRRRVFREFMARWRNKGTI